MRGVWGNRFRDPGSGHQAWSTLVSNNGLRGPTERYVEPSGADLGSVLGHVVGPPPGGSEASRIGCRASFFPLPFLRRRSYRHSRNNCGNSRSGLVWSGLVWSAIFLRSVAFFSARGGSLADRPGAVTTWLVSSPFSGACQTRPHWRHQALNQTRPQRPSTAAAATKIATSRRRATDDDEGCFSHFRS